MIATLRQTQREGIRDAAIALLNEGIVDTLVYLVNRSRLSTDTKVLVEFHCTMTSWVALQRAAQQRAGAEAFGTPMPKTPEPDETHYPLRKSRASILVEGGSKNESEGHRIGHLERFPRCSKLARQLDIKAIFPVTGEVGVRGQYGLQPSL